MANQECIINNNKDTTLRHRYESIEERRRSFLLYFGNSLACVFLLAFGLADLLKGHQLLATFLLIHAGITVINIVIFRLSSNHDWGGYGFAYGMLALFTFLVWTGALEGTGPLWGFPLAAAAVTVLRARIGLKVIAIMSAIALVLFLAPSSWVGTLPYSAAFKIRYIATFLAMILFMGLHEYARSRSQNELLRLSTQLDELSQTDALTGLPNRRFMHDRLEEENSRYLRHEHPYAILYGDVDDFKQINDRYGHHAGDEALRLIAQTLRGNLRQHDLVCRWGGEEFLVLLPETEAKVANEVAEKLRQAVAAIAFRPAGGEHRLTMSLGLHTVASRGTIESFLQQADQKLYRAKQTGKNRTVAEPAEV